ncbi:hypothetical protein DIJ64_03790 [Mycobacterium leprae]|uniref:Uncharacterized protein n=1 Tax=Mycobacterium leprae TaxID=1769 RepID=A0AAD0P6G9_MYCLR|nr:hypothetical protein [Mycobacterium leprae]AWV47527.1 hypothetical protein DIJ64_03790 [Mycobacterium leprae]OAR21722.1 hypothetical protein A8144_00480 [Mycobacterium leprae 3125609]OAX72261.1 hypothetical protein A3216_00545 [Mycobacterium leprae 7935681]
MHATSAYFPDNERASIAITNDPRSITYEQVAELRSRFSKADVIELSYHTGIESMLAHINTELAVTECRYSIPLKRIEFR